MRVVFIALLALAYAPSALACYTASEEPKKEARGYYKDASGRSCFEASFKGKIYRSCY